MSLQAAATGYLALPLDGSPELAELREVDTLVTVLVSLVNNRSVNRVSRKLVMNQHYLHLVDEPLGLALAHAAPHLLHQLPQLVLGDHPITVHVEQLEGLHQRQCDRRDQLMLVGSYS